MTRIFQDIPLQRAAVITLDEAASHHLARVLRAAIGDPVIIFNGKGGEYAGTITQIDKKKVTVLLQAHDPREAESPLTICLAQGISRGEKMDYTIQKAVELGVTSIAPLFTERCNVKLDRERSEKRLQHWQSVVISACEQSGRNFVPVVSAAQDYAAWLQEAKAEVKLILSPDVTHKLTALKIPAGAKIILLAGPEGGLSEREIKAAFASGFLPLNLGPRILRTETAALAALAALQTKFGDFYES